MIFGDKEFTKELRTHRSVKCRQECNLMVETLFDVLPEISFNLVIDI